MRLALALVVALLTGCATTQQVATVPVARACPAAQERLERPELPIKKLNPTDEPSAVVKAYASTVELLKGYSQALEEKLEACK